MKLILVEDEYIEDSDEGSSDTEVEEEDDDMLEIPTVKQKKKRKDLSNGVQRRLIIEPNVEGVKIEKNYRKLFYGKSSLSDIGLKKSQKKDWKKVDNTLFTPLSEYSPEFSITTMFAASDKDKMRRIKRFSGQFADNHWMLYTGGPVVCLVSLITLIIVVVDYHLRRPGVPTTQTRIIRCWSWCPD